jgi:hypothetical protein
MDKRKLTLRLSEELHRKLVVLARREDRSVNGAAEVALRCGVQELLPHPERVTALGQLASHRGTRRRFGEHLSPTGPCDCSAGEAAVPEFQEAKGG